jgi:hypothetical protein
MANRESRRSGSAKQPQGSEADRRRVAGYFVAGLLIAAVIGGLIVVFAADGGGDSSSESASGDPFGPHYPGLEQRRLDAGVPTMAEGGGDHFHAHLQIYVNGEEVTVPSDIGVDPEQSPTAMAGLHTHDESGTIHNEAGSDATLGAFFAVWGVPFSEQELGPYEASRSKVVRMWVDGQPSEEFGDLLLEDGQEIVIAYGPEDAPPPPGIED